MTVLCLVVGVGNQAVEGRPVDLKKKRRGWLQLYRVNTRPPLHESSALVEGLNRVVVPRVCIHRPVVLWGCCVEESREGMRLIDESMRHFHKKQKKKNKKLQVQEALHKGGFT